jgi:hypothetical protein
MTLADLRHAAELLPPGSSVMVPRDALLEALAVAESSSAPAAIAEPTAASPEPEAWLTAAECADRLHVSARWCYDHAVDLGAKRLSRRCVRFSSRAVARYMRRA